MALSPNYGFPEPDNTGLVKNGAQDMRALGDAIDAFLFRPLARNFIINGNFDIFQRSTFNSQTASNYSLDRWYAGVGGTVTITQQTTGVPVGAQFCMRIAYNAASSFANQFQALESANARMLAGQTVTATILVRANASWAATSGQSLNFYVEKNSTPNTLTGGTWTSIGTTVVTAASIATGTTSSSWTKLTITCAVPNDGTAAGLRVRIGEAVVGPSGAYWEMAQCQLEVGSQATPFTRAGENIQAELAMCQRYYWRWNASSNFATCGIGAASSTTVGVITVLHPVPMRTAVSAIDSSANSTLRLQDQVTGLTQTGASIEVSQQDVLKTDLNITVSGATQYRFYRYGANNSTSAFVGFSAEL